MFYQWLVLLHIVGVAGFLIAHGVSVFVLFRIRTVAPDRTKITDLVSFSGSTVLAMYVSIGVLLLGGVGAGLKGHWFSYWWIWAALGVLIASIGLMTAIAKPYFTRVTEACEVRPSGVPRRSDEELQEILAGSTTTVITVIGATSLAIILYLMIFKPGF